MIGTNRDLIEMRHILDREILRLQQLAAEAPGPGWIDRRLEMMYRQRISVCAALVNRRVEAANQVVVFSRWVSGGGALGSLADAPVRSRSGLDSGWRRRSDA